MIKANKKPYPGTQAILRAITLLQMFTDVQPEWNLVALGQAAGLNRTTTYRILSALESTGMVAYNPANDTYSLGSEMIVFGARALRAHPLREVTRPELVALARKTGEMATLEQLQGSRTLILDEVKGKNQRRITTSLGNLWPAHATSTGKILLAHLAEAEREAILSRPLERLTAQTITDKARLSTQLELARIQGYALAVNELEIGLTEVATPIFNYEGKAVAAISIGGPTIRLPEANLLPIIGFLKETAAKISNQLGYRP